MTFKAHFRKLLIPVFLFLMALNIPASVMVRGQSMEAPKGLSIKGEVTKLKITEEGSDQICDISLKLEFINTSSSPVVMLLGTYESGKWWLLNTRLARSLKDVSANRYIYTGGVGPSYSGLSPEWDELRRRLNTSAPPSGITITIPPGKLYVYHCDTFVKLSKSDIISTSSPLWLLLTIEMWPQNIETGPGNSFGKRLKKRWQSYGKLQLDAMTSDPIQLDLQQNRTS